MGMGERNLSWNILEEQWHRCMFGPDECVRGCGGEGLGEAENDLVKTEI